LVFAVVKIIIHFDDEDNGLISKRPMRDFKAYIHSFFYLIGFARREEAGGGRKFYGSQKMVYLGLIYGIGLMGISGITMYLFSLPETVLGIFKLTHFLTAGFLFLVLGFHVLMTIKRHDLTELKCSYLTGKLPLWHIKKHHKIWYREIIVHERKYARYRSLKIPTKSKDQLAKAIQKLTDIETPGLPSKKAEKIAMDLRTNIKQEEIDYIIDTSKAI
jgi:hypothetical protein